jgi:hypothetical protein
MYAHNVAPAAFSASTAPPLYGLINLRRLLGCDRAERIFWVIIMSIWWRRPGPEDNYGISAGQRFASVGRGNTVWEVITVARYPGDLGPHARLARVGMENDGKTISLHVLRDRRFYHPAS